MTTASVGGLARWWFAPAPLARVARLRVLVYLYIPVDVLVTTPWVRGHRSLPPEQYQPLLVGRLLHLPTPTTVLVDTVMVLLLAAAMLAATGRWPRIVGGAVFVLYFAWMVIAMSYGKVDHDRFAFLVALAVLPTVGPAGWRDATRSEAAGWALRMVQVAVVATYFLSAWAKFRFGGFGWVNSAVLVVAILRRGTPLARTLLDNYEVLRATQWGIVVVELASPLVLHPAIQRRERLLAAAVAGFAAFHLMTYAMIKIIFLPHLVCLLAFLPLERFAVPGPVRARLRRGTLSP